MKALSIMVFGAIVCLSCVSNSEKENPELAQGKEVYIAHCITCHGEKGEGIAGFYPPLLRPGGIIQAHTTRAIQLIKYGSGFENGMKPIALTPEEITEVVNYIQNSWGNTAPFLSESQVEALQNR